MIAAPPAPRDPLGSRALGTRSAGPAVLWLILALAWSSASVEAEDRPSPFEACAEELRASDPGWYGCGCYYRVGIREGKLPEAAERLRALVDDPAFGRCARFDLARLGLLTGDDDALRLLREAAQGFARHGEKEGEIYARLNASRAARRAGSEDQAAIELAHARRVAESHAEPKLEAQVLLQQARLALARGDDLHRVEAGLVATQRKASGVDSPSLHRDLLQARGNVRYLLGRYEEAAFFYRRMAEVCQRAGDAYGETSALLAQVIARTAPGLGPADRERVRSWLNDVLDSALTTGQRHAEAEARLRLGMLPDASGRRDREHLGQAMRIASELDASEIRIRALAALATTHIEDDPATARRLAAESSELASAVPQYGSSAYGWWGRMEVEWRTASPSAAMDSGLHAIERVEDLRERQRRSGERAEVFAVWTELYYSLAGRLLTAATRLPAEEERNRMLAAAFEVVERMRARALYETLEAARAANDEPSRPMAPPTKAEGFADPAAIRSLLEADEALISFQIAPEEDVYGVHTGGSWAIVLTAGSSRVVPLPDRHRLESAIRLFLSLIARRDGSERIAAERLYAALLEPAMADLPAAIGRLILVLDGPLHRLPFASLRSADQRRLVDRFDLSVAPSATLFGQWRRSSNTESIEARPTGVLALADPPTGLPGTLPDLPPLPSARDEARAAVEALGGSMLVGAEAKESVLHQQDTASHAALHFAAHSIVEPGRPEESAIVLAADEEHSTLLEPTETGPVESDHRSIDGSAAEISGTERQASAERGYRAGRAEAGGDSGPRDGLLRLAEIARLRLPDRLVVLSACRTAEGRLLAGEGPLSLARAFFEAGSRSVVASHWPLRDDETHRLFEDFYGALANGRTIAEALAESQRAAVARGAPAAAWAGVTVFGDGNLRIAASDAGLPHTGGTESRFLLYASPILASILVWLLIARIAKRRA